MTLWDVLGWVANGCFFARFLIQWLVSERAGKSLTPRFFWRLSLLGTGLMIVCTWVEDQPVLLAGFAVTGSLYLRNVWLSAQGARAARLSPPLAMGLGILLAAALIALRIAGGAVHEDAPGWIALGILGEAVWTSRFVLQWMHGERTGRVVFTPAFWWTSLIGNALMLTYTIHLGEAKYVAGYVPGPIIQIRNLMLWKRAPEG
jgi:lipid-A-disaccharide synthase-like uncharacterized protein